ncbi:hypothetical protein Acsp03_70330 [Actinomadura sp. NBRC 104412]|nr:hypothetical protein Acsp03_70330 [Actinomadura sp. NBRC 104412]
MRTTRARAGRILGSAPVPEKAPDHPRVRGEQRYELASNTACWGPSPHARGEQVRSIELAEVDRTTPLARENSGRGGSRTLTTGPLPLARGKPANADHLDRGIRTNPRSRGGELPQGLGGAVAVRTTLARAGRTRLRET